MADSNAKRQAKMRARRAAAGLCATCGQLPPGGGRRQCAACNAAGREQHKAKASAKRERDRARYAERRAAGLCTECSGTLLSAVPGQVRCEKHRESQRLRSKRHAAADPIRRKSASLKNKFGITYADKMAMLAAQGGRCAGCKSETPQHARGWAVDHCHATGKIRGILCQPCNIILGMAKDKPLTLERLSRYLVIRGSATERQASLVNLEKIDA
jgi:hypothetical protein